MSIDLHIVWRVGENDVGAFIAQQDDKVVRRAGIAAQEAMSTQLPDLAPAGHRYLAGVGNDVFGRVVAFGVRGTGLVNDEINLSDFETREVDVEFKVEQALQLDREDFFVPPGVKRQLVVGQDVSAPLRLGQMRERDRGNGFHPEELGSLDTAMTSDDIAIIRDEDWVGEAELFNRLRNLLDLRLRMRACIAGIRPQSAHCLFNNRGYSAGHRWSSTGLKIVC